MGESDLFFDIDARTAPPKSARALFRATGKAAKEGLAREKNDFYPTPPEPTLALLRDEGDYLRRVTDAGSHAIWEPAAGDGAMVRLMQDAGLRVVASDLVDRGAGCIIRSFYDFEKAPSPIIVTNPPFCECNSDGKFRWLKHAWNIGVEVMILLLPVHWACPAAAGEWWERWRPIRKHEMTWKIDFTGQGSPPGYHAWFVWERRGNDHCELRRMVRPNPSDTMLDLGLARETAFRSGARP